MFNEKLDVKLINLVKDNPVLYDYSHSKYMDFNAREVAWQKIGDELKRPAGDCKVRWINIRDVHRRILKKNIANPNNRSRQYKYEVQLAFMKPFYKDVAFTSSDYDNDDKSLWEEDDPNDFSALTEPIEESDDSEKPIQKLVGKKGGRKRKKKLTYEEEEKPEVSFNESASAEFDPADPVDAFLLSIGATLKTFNPYHLNLAKSKIFAVVQEHDLQQIVQKSNEVKMTTEVLYME